MPDALERDGKADTSCALAPTSTHSILREQWLDFRSTYHSGGGAEDDCLESSNVYVDFGEDEPEELKGAITLMIEDAKNIALMEAGAHRLWKIIERYPVLEANWENPFQQTSHR